jgi:hypothetical protein
VRSDRVRHLYGIALVGIAVLALGLRAIPLFAALPYSHYVDEGHVVRASSQVVADGSWDPHFYDYPSGLIGATAAVGMTWAVATGDAGDLRREARTYTRDGLYDPMPTEFLLGARLLVLLSSIGVVLLVAHLGRVLLGRGVGLVSGFLAACLPGLATRSATASVDAPASLFALGAIACALKVRGSPHGARWAIAAGALAGCAAGTKYTMAVVMGAVVVGIAVDTRSPWTIRGLRAVGAGFAGLVTFAVANPAFFLARGRVSRTLSQLSDGYASKTGSSYWDVARLPEEVGWVMLALAAVGLVVLLARTRTRLPTLVVLAFAVPFVLFVSRYPFQPFRNLYPVLALGCVAAGSALVVGCRALGNRAGAPRVSSRALAGTLAVLLGVLLVGHSYDTVHHDAQAVDTRSQLREWFADRPDCDRVLVASELTVHPDEIDGFGCLVEFAPAFDVDHEVDLSRYDYVVTGAFDEEVAAWAGQRWVGRVAAFGQEPIAGPRLDHFRTNRQAMVVYRI